MVWWDEDMAMIGQQKPRGKVEARGDFHPTLMTDLLCQIFLG